MAVMPSVIEAFNAECHGAQIFFTCLGTIYARLNVLLSSIYTAEKTV